MGATDVEAQHESDGHEHTSRWPLIAALGGGALYAGLGLILVGLDLVPFFIPLGFVAVGVVGLLVGLAGWAHEAFVADYWDSRADHEDVYVGGMILFLLSDVATFSAGFVYFAFIRAGAWPPTHLPHLLGSLVVLNTAVLLASSGTIHYAHHALEHGNRRRFLGLLAVTLALGVLFVGGQVLEYYEFVVQEEFSLSTGVFGSAFYGLTGLHGLHVSLGVVLLAITMARALKGHYVEGRDTAVRTVAMYWHFVDAVWVFLVVVLYVGASIG